jgi:N-acetyl-gamma-glutamyl-phosphate reductase
MTKPTLFIDGEAGTTGLEIRQRLEKRYDVSLVSIDPAKRKDTTERKRLLNECTLSILCLPDDAAREAVALVDNPAARIIDASTAFRTDPNWAYGFPELTKDNTDKIRNSKRVSNPGCYPTGALAFLRPLTDAGLLPRNDPITVNAISGYSGGGKELIALCEAERANSSGNVRGGTFALYGLDQKHKHLPEMRLHGGLDHEPIFLPSYSNAIYRGMLVHIAMQGINGEKAHTIIASHFAGQKYVHVEPLRTELEKGFVLSAETQNGTNNLQLQVFWNAQKQTTILTACLDNLGKGASGAAVQNMEIMLGLEKA